MTTPASVPIDADDRMRLPDDVQQTLLDVAHRKRLVRGDSLFIKGSSPDALFGVIAGSLRVSARNELSAPFSAAELTAQCSGSTSAWLERA